MESFNGTAGNGPSERVLRRIPLSQIDCEPQVRTVQEEGLDGLAQSLASVGLQQPIVVRPSGARFVVTDGERRVRAARIVGWDSIEAVIDNVSLTDADRVVRQLVANCQRENLTPIETARAIEQLLKATGCTCAEAAARLGFPASAVSKLLALLSLPAEVQARVHGDTLPASTAYEIAKVKDPTRRSALIEAALTGGLTRDAAARRSRERDKSAASGGADGSRRKTTRRIVLAVGEKRSVIILGRDLNVAGLIEALELATAQVRKVDPETSSAALPGVLAAPSGNGHRAEQGARSKSGRRTAKTKARRSNKAA